jgi:hypothetical protein
MLNRVVLSIALLLSLLWPDATLARMGEYCTPVKSEKNKAAREFFDYPCVCTHHHISCIRR